MLMLQYLLSMTYCITNIVFDIVNPPVALVGVYGKNIW